MDQDKKELPRELSSYETESDKQWAMKNNEIKQNVADEFEQIERNVNAFLKLAKRSKHLLDQSSKKNRDRRFTTDLAYEGVSRVNQWAAEYPKNEEEVSLDVRTQVERETSEEERLIDSLSVCYVIMRDIVCESLRRRHLATLAEKGFGHVKDETTYGLAYNKYKAADAALFSARKEMRPLEEILELAIAKREQAHAFVTVAESNKVATEATVKFTELKLKQHISRLDAMRDELAGENKEELDKLQREKDLLLNIMNLAEIFKEVYLEQPADRISNALLNGNYGNLQTPYAERTRDYVSRLKDSAAFVKYEIKQDMSKLRNIEEAIRDINDTLNTLLAEFDKEHKTNLCKDKLAYDDAIDLLAVRSTELENAKSAVLQSEEEVTEANSAVKASKAKEKEKFAEFEDATKNLEDSYKSLRQSAIDARYYANKMLGDDSRVTKEANKGISESAKEVFGKLDEEEEKNTMLVSK